MPLDIYVLAMIRPGWWQKPLRFVMWWIYVRHLIHLTRLSPEWFSCGIHQNLHGNRMLLTCRPQRDKWVWCQNWCLTVAQVATVSFIYTLQCTNASGFVHHLQCLPYDIHSTAWDFSWKWCIIRGVYDAQYRYHFSWGGIWQDIPSIE